MTRPVHREAGDVRGVDGARRQIADGNLRTAGVQYVKQRATFVVLSSVVPTASSYSQTIRKEAAREHAVGEGQGAVTRDPERGDRALSAVRVVCAGAVVFGRTLGVDDEQQAMIRIELHAAGRTQRIHAGQLQAATAATGGDRLYQVQVSVGRSVINLDLIVPQRVGHRVDRAIRPRCSRGQ